jgi:plastocyanin
MRERTRLVAVAVGLTLAVGCSGDTSQKTPEAAETPAPQGVYGVAPLPVGGTPSVITLEGGELSASPEQQPRITQRGLTFDPARLIARVGDTVVVTNNDQNSHNVHVRLTDNDSTYFNGDTDPGFSVHFVLDHEGGYDITCDEHPGMRSFIYATAAPRAVFAELAGHFVLPDVPNGSYTLTVWSVDPTQRRQIDIDVTGPSTEVSLVPPGS